MSQNHTIAKQILDTHPHSFFGVEELTGIRERSKRKRGKKCDEQAATRESSCLEMGVCGTTRAAHL